VITKDVTTVRGEVNTYLPDWSRVRDVLGGERAVKEKRETYLPKPNAADTSDENRKRYDQYVERAVFFNATKRTMDGMIGIAFRRWPEVTTPPKVEEFLHDIDGAAGGLVNQSRRAVEEALSAGRLGLLVDYPVTGGAVSQAEERAGNLHATVTLYRAEQIINWRRDSKGQLSLVVLAETVEVFDEYEVKAVEQWRELLIGNLDGETQGASYIVRVWQKDKEGNPQVISAYRPTAGDGKPWSEIPFQFIGATDNDVGIDRAPLYDLANLNIAHYRNSADYEESVYFNGQPTVAISGLTETWVAEVLKGQVFMGSRAAIPLPEGGSIALVQADANTLAGEALNKKEAQMVALGARLLTPGEAVKTAEQSRSETAAAHSVLSLVCDNVSDGYTQALKWVARFSRQAEDDVSYEIHTDFTGLVADPQLISALVAGWQSGALPRNDLNAALRQIGIIDPEKTDEEIDDELSSEGGGLELDDDAAPAVV